MKYLLILLFLFSTHSFSGEIDGKGIDCILTSDRSNQEYKNMFWFNNSKVIYVQVGFLKKRSGGFYITKFPKIKNITDYKSAKFYGAHSNKIIWTINQERFVLNRKTLELKKTYDDREKPIYKGTCKVFKGFQKVKKRQTEKIKEFQKKVDKQKEGNKI